MAKFNIDQVLDAVESGEYIGICLACGNEQEGVEPDARGYECEHCGAMKVCGAEEILLSAGVFDPNYLERL